MRLLVTRPEPDAAALADELLALGHEPVVQPLLEFQPLDFDPAPLKTAGALIVTSRNGLRALQGRIDPGGIAGCPVFCVGGETERGLRQAGFQAIAAVAETAEQLAAAIAKTAAKGASLVHVTGEHQAFDLAGALEGRGFSIATLRVYEMKAASAFSGAVVGCVRGRQYRRRDFNVAAHGGDLRFPLRAARPFGSRKVPRLLLLSEKCVK